MALNVSNSSNLEQLVLKGLMSVSIGKGFNYLSAFWLDYNETCI